MQRKENVIRVAIKDFQNDYKNKFLLIKTKQTLRHFVTYFILITFVVQISSLDKIGRKYKIKYEC